jgi:hypothetical protein
MFALAAINGRFAGDFIISCRSGTAALGSMVWLERKRQVKQSFAP